MKYSFQNERTKYCHYPDPFHFFSQNHIDDWHWHWAWLWWLKAAWFLFSLTNWNRGLWGSEHWAHLGIPQPSALQWKSADLSSMQAQGMEAHRLTEQLWSLLNPHAHSWMGRWQWHRRFPFAPPCTSVASAEVQLTVGDSDCYPVSQRTWALSTLALVKVPELQEPAVETSHEFLPVWFLTKCTFSTFTPFS